MTSDHITVLLNSSDKLPPETLAWLQAGFACHLATGENLQKCLGIVRRDYLKAKRNGHLYNAFQYIDGDSIQSRCDKLLEMIDSSKWEIYTNKLDTPDPGWSILRTEIFHALHCDVGMPGSVRMIENIVKVRN